MADPEKEKDASEGSKVGADLFMELMKDQNLMLMQLRKSMDALHDVNNELTEAIWSLDQHVVGQNTFLARQNYVDDKMLEIYQGDPDANPPVPGREPTVADRVKAIQEYEKQLEEDAQKALEEEDREKQQEEALQVAAPKAPIPLHPPKEAAPIISSKPPGKSRPPLPVVKLSSTGEEPKPAEEKQPAEKPEAEKPDENKTGEKEA
jgi:hypothetical protein